MLYKFHPKDKETSKYVQQTAFKYGWQWADGTKEVANFKTFKYGENGDWFLFNDDTKMLYLGMFNELGEIITTVEELERFLAQWRSIEKQEPANMESTSDKHYFYYYAETSDNVKTLLKEAAKYGWNLDESDCENPALKKGDVWFYFSEPSKEYWISVYPNPSSNNTCQNLNDVIAVLKNKSTPKPENEPAPEDKSTPETDTPEVAPNCGDFVFKVSCQDVFKAIQLIAFGFGWKWVGGQTTLMYLERETYENCSLIFYVNTRRFRYANYDEEHSAIFIKSLSDAVSYLAAKEVMEENGAVFHRDGSVDIVDKETNKVFRKISAEDWEQHIQTRAQFLAQFKHNK